MVPTSLAVLHLHSTMVIQLGVIRSIESMVEWLYKGEKEQTNSNERSEIENRKIEMHLPVPKCIGESFGLAKRAPIRFSCVYIWFILNGSGVLWLPSGSLTGE